MRRPTHILSKDYPTLFMSINAISPYLAQRTDVKMLHDKIKILPIEYPHIFFWACVSLFTLTVLMMFFTWKLFKFAEYTDAANAFYLRERNTMIDAVSSVYFRSKQIDAILEKLGLTTSLIENNFRVIFEENYEDDPLSMPLDNTAKEQLASLLILQNTPLEIGTALLPQAIPKIDKSASRTFEKAKSFEKAFNEFRLALTRIPSILPVTGRLKSLFGSRIHPVHKKRSFHTGIDIAADAGTPVVATADGTVKMAGNNGGYGKTITIGHSSALETKYSHLAQLKVKSRQTVKRGEIIGTVGATGVATGPHLHYEVHLQGQPVDPRKFIFN